MVYSASALLAMDRYERPYHFLLRQVAWAVMGFGLLWGVMRIDYRRFRKPGAVWTAIGVTTVALVLVLFSEPINGTRRWFGIAGFGVQPSELAKVALDHLRRGAAREADGAGQRRPLRAAAARRVDGRLLGPDFAAAGLQHRVRRPRDRGRDGLRRGSRLPLRGRGALLLAPALYAVVASAPYRRRRLLAFSIPGPTRWATASRSSSPRSRSVRAASWAGDSCAACRSCTSCRAAPDFIYAVIAEETGLIGATVILLCFAVITWRGFHVASHAPDRFGAFLAIG